MPGTVQTQSLTHRMELKLTESSYQSMIGFNHTHLPNFLRDMSISTSRYSQYAAEFSHLVKSFFEWMIKIELDKLVQR